MTIAVIGARSDKERVFVELTQTYQTDIGGVTLWCPEEGTLSPLRRVVYEVGYLLNGHRDNVISFDSLFEAAYESVEPATDECARSWVRSMRSAAFKQEHMRYDRIYVMSSGLTPRWSAWLTLLRGSYPAIDRKAYYDVTPQKVVEDISQVLGLLPRP